ncbi:MAG: 3-phosphoshikimate 1-carboxyvinyltransferase [Deltaproteobacteria bacterium]|nr:3-phosphoshikimate 1-carboxyvinyltransferase [Deltaproteobacteria bacterium]
MHSSHLTISPPSAPLSGEVFIPGSKSYTNRALILASLADGKSSLRSFSESDDSVVLCEALKKLGIRIEKQGAELYVCGSGGNFVPYKGEIDVGPAGTSMRFLAALCAFVPGCELVLKGSERMHKRPIKELTEALKTLGADIEYLGSEGCPPLLIRGVKAPKKAQVRMNGSVSSQFFTALMLTASLFGELAIDVKGEQISKSYIDMTLSSLKAFGLEGRNESYRRYILSGSGALTPCNYQIEGDASGASYFWGLAAVSGGSIKVRNINPNSAQGDVRFPLLLKKMGCSAESGYEEGVGWILLQGSERLKGITADMSLMPDTAQTLAVIAAFASSPSRLTGLSTLRIKETDRLNALQVELKKMGITTEIGDDYIVIHPGQPGAASIATYEDHRMAMSFAVAAAKIHGIIIEEPNVVTKSFPTFWSKMKALGFSIV